MPYVVELLLDDDAAGRVRELWQQLADAGLPSRYLDLELSPHVTIAVFDDLDPGAARDAFASFAAEEMPEPISLYSPASFPTDEGVLYLAPIVTRGLLSLHSGFHERFSDLDQPVGEYFFTGQWVPHVTVGLGLDDDQLAEGFRILREAALPIVGTLDRLQLFEFQRDAQGAPTGPMHVHYRHPLGG